MAIPILAARVTYLAVTAAEAVGVFVSPGEGGRRSLGEVSDVRPEPGKRAEPEVAQVTAVVKPTGGYLKMQAKKERTTRASRGNQGKRRRPKDR